jgi:hypothetical protein
LDIDATPKQRQRGGQSANTAADDNNIPRRIHGALRSILIALDRW